MGVKKIRWGYKKPLEIPPEYKDVKTATTGPNGEKLTMGELDALMTEQRSQEYGKLIKLIPDFKKSSSTEQPSITINIDAKEVARLEAEADESILSNAVQRRNEYKETSDLETKDYQNYLKKTTRRQRISDRLTKVFAVGAVADSFVPPDLEISGLHVKLLTSAVSHVSTILLTGKIIIPSKYNAKNTKVEHDESAAYDAAYLSLDQAIDVFKINQRQLAIDTAREGLFSEKVVAGREGNRNILKIAIITTEQNLTQAIGAVEASRVHHLSDRGKKNHLPYGEPA